MLSLNEDWRRFCSLTYHPEATAHSRSGIQPFVILLAVENERGSIELFVAPNLWATVEEEDREYLAELFLDLCERAPLLPNDLLQQLSGLAVGILQTDRVDEVEAARDYLTSFCMNFVDLCQSAGKLQSF